VADVFSGSSSARLAAEEACEIMKNRNEGEIAQLGWLWKKAGCNGNLHAVQLSHNTVESQSRPKPTRLHTSVLGADEAPSSPPPAPPFFFFFFFLPPSAASPPAAGSAQPCACWHSDSEPGHRQDQVGNGGGGQLARWLEKQAREAGWVVHVGSQEQRAVHLCTAVERGVWPPRITQRRRVQARALKTA